MRLCVIDLAGHPRGKGRGRATVRAGHGAIYTDAKTRTYEAQLRYAGQRAMVGKPPSDRPIRLTITTCFEIPASWSKKKRAQALGGYIWPTVKPDWDNTGKIVGDSLNGICWLDDKQIVMANVMKVYAERPGLVIEVETLAPPVFRSKTELPDLLALQNPA